MVYANLLTQHPELHLWKRRDQHPLLGSSWGFSLLGGDQPYLLFFPQSLDIFLNAAVTSFLLLWSQKE